MGRLPWAPPLLAALFLALAFAAAADAGKTQPRSPLRLSATTARSAQWRTWWGNATFGANGVTLSSRVPTSPAETHSALVTSKSTWSDQTISVTTTTLAQLRVGSAPNPWEVGWVMFRFRDLANYYYFILKPNGYELGKKQGSDAQIFLATGEEPRLLLESTHEVRLHAQGARIRVFVDGAQILDFTDPHPLLAAGSVGLYEEDSQVRFGSVAATAL